MTVANPTKAEIERMLDGLVYRDGTGERRRLTVSDDPTGFEQVRVAYAGTVSPDDPRAVWQIEASGPYGTDLMPLTGAVLTALTGSFAIAQPWTGEVGVAGGGVVTATLRVESLGTVTG